MSQQNKAICSVTRSSLKAVPLNCCHFPHFSATRFVNISTSWFNFCIKEKNLPIIFLSVHMGESCAENILRRLRLYWNNLISGSPFIKAKKFHMLVPARHTRPTSMFALFVLYRLQKAYVLKLVPEVIAFLKLRPLSNRPRLWQQATNPGGQEFTYFCTLINRNKLLSTNLFYKLFWRK